MANYRLAFSIAVVGLLALNGCTEYPARSIDIDVAKSSKSAFLHAVSDFAQKRHLKERIVPPLGDRPDSTFIFLDGAGVQITIANDAYDTKFPERYQVACYKAHFSFSSNEEVKKVADELISSVQVIPGVVVVGQHNEKGHPN